MEPLKPLQVFWIDDQHEEMLSFKVQAEQYGIILHPFTSAEEGLPVLGERLDFFDAVLFDALFFQRKDQVSGTEEVDGLSAAIATVNQLKHRKAFTPFILTGQERLDTDKTFKASFGEFYSKRDPLDVLRLFKDIRFAAEAMEDTQIRHRYQRVFDVCTERYIGRTAAGELLTILRRENDETFIPDANKHINTIRKIVEDVFRACHREGLVPETFVKGKVAINEIRKFLSGSVERGYRVKSNVVPNLISKNLENILDVAQPASHRANVDAHMKTVHSPYLLYSITYMLLDVLLWFRAFADSLPDAPLYEKVESSDIDALHIGPIEKDADGNFHCGPYSLSPRRLTDERYVLGEQLAITRVVDNNHERSQRLYPKYAIRFNKV